MSRSRFAWVYLSFALIALGIYAGALRGPFVSDDGIYIVGNPYVRGSTHDLVAELFDPTGDARIYATGNYAPVHVLGHVLEWRLWGPRTPGYHVVNVALHALNATLLVALLAAAAVAMPVALLAGLFFLVHPANVEAVAWISQLKSVLALAFALGALLLYRTRPLASAPLFALALLTKAIAAFALPMAAGLWWAWRRRPAQGPRHGAGLLVWAALFAAYAPIQFGAFAAGGASFEEPYADAATQLRSMASLGAHYVAMAATGHGTSAFHQPAPVTSSLDPWWLAGLALAGFFIWRVAVALRDRREEAAWWLGAAAAYAPVCQLFPFYFAMADRYLYFILPGLLGGSVLAARSVLARRLRARQRPLPAAAPAVAVVAAVLLLVPLLLQARARAALWVDSDRLLADAAACYPDGAIAHFQRAVAAIEAGESEAAVEHLREAAARGADDHNPFRVDPRLARLRGNPQYEALLDELARRDIALARERGFTAPSRLRRVAMSHYRLGELDEAIAVLEDAIRHGGPGREELVGLYSELRTLRAQQRRADGE